MREVGRIAERVVRAMIGETISIKVPGIEKLIDEVPTVPGKFINQFDDPSIQKKIDGIMRSKGFGSRHRGNGKYSSDYWNKGGKSWRVKDIINDALIMEEFLPGPIR